LEFAIIKSRQNKLYGFLEGSKLSDVICQIGGTYRVNADKLRTIYEIRENDAEVFTVMNGGNVLVEMIPFREA